MRDLFDLVSSYSGRQGDLVPRWLEDEHLHTHHPRVRREAAGKMDAVLRDQSSQFWRQFTL